MALLLRQCHRTSVDVLKRRLSLGRMCESVSTLSLVTSVRFMSFLSQLSSSFLVSMIFCSVHLWEEADVNDNERDCISAVNNYDSSS